MVAARRELAPAGGDAARAVDWLRVALVPLLAFSQLVPIDDRLPVAFVVVLAVYGAYALVRLQRRYHGRELLPDVVAVSIDIATMTVLCLLSGGGLSMVWHAFLVLPLATAFEYRAGTTALVGFTSAVAFLAQAAVHATASTATVDAWPTVTVRTAYVLWVTAACSALAWVLERRGRVVRDLMAAQQQLLVDALSAGDVARSQVAETLHDHALQDLLVARQELAEAPDSDAVRRARTALDQTRDDLRGAVSALHPFVLDAAGLADAVRRLAQDAARRGGLDLDLTVDEHLPAGPYDRLLYAAARELLANVVKHAQASSVRVELTGHARGVELVVQDDGTGPGDGAAALAAGHIGLATQRARLAASGGTLEVTGDAGSGTRARVLVPTAAVSPLTPSV